MFRKIDIITSICISILMITLLSVESDINEWTKDAAQWQSFQDYCGFLEKHTLINLMLACSCIAVFVWRGLIIWKDNDFRLYRPLLILLGFVVINLDINQNDINIVLFITYRILLTFLLIVISLLVVYKAFKAYKTFVIKRGNKDQTKGFSTDDIDIKN